MGGVIIEELLQVFDKEKNMIDESIERSEKHLLNNGKHFMVIMIFIENNEKYLIQKVSAEKGGSYATTGGHVSLGDNGFITCIKEVKEELGIDLLDENITYINTIDYKNCFVEVYYTNQLIKDDEIILQESEVESVSWLSKYEINNLINNDLFRKGNIKPFNMVLEYKKAHNHMC